MKKNYPIPRCEITQDWVPGVGLLKTEIRMLRRRALDNYLADLYLTDSDSKDSCHEIFLRRFGDFAYTLGIVTLNLFYIAGIDYLINK